MKKETPPDVPAPASRSVLLWVEPDKIALFKAIIESYDNLATLRTEDPSHHYLRLYFDAASEADLMELLGAIGAGFSLRLIT